jgi:hypothetical protein
VAPRYTTIHRSAWKESSRKYGVASSGYRTPYKGCGPGQCGVSMGRGLQVGSVRGVDSLRAVATRYRGFHHDDRGELDVESCGIEAVYGFEAASPPSAGDMTDATQQDLRLLQMHVGW